MVAQHISKYSQVLQLFYVQGILQSTKVILSFISYSTSPSRIQASMSKGPPLVLNTPFVSLFSMNLSIFVVYF